MGQSGFEDKRGLAYPPNVQPKLEAWMERVRVTLGKILDSSVDAARINAVTLDVDELGNVTAQISPNENTKWIEYYGLTSDYPTIAQIVASGTEVRVWDTPGETYTTGTLTTLTDGQTYFFGALAYEEEEADTLSPAGSTSVPVYAEITYAAPGAPGSDTIIPTVEEKVTRSGSTGTVTLVINDPGSYVTGVSFATYTGQAWNSWVDDYVDPYDLDESVTMHELHNVGIKWRVRYDIGAGNVFIQNAVMFDIDSNPELSEGYLTIDTTNGNVYYYYVGDDDTLSVLYEDAASDWTTDALAKTAAEAGTAIDGRSGPDTGGTLVYSALAEGATRYFAVVARDAASGAGNSGSQVYRYVITRPTDTTTDTVPPTVTGDATYPSASSGKLTLTIDWGSYSVGTVEFNTKSGLAAWSGFSPDTAPYDATVTLTDKHDSHIAYKITYGGSKTIQDTVTFDVDTAPELQTAYISVDDAGDATLVWAGDDDVDYIRWKAATGTDPAYPSWTTPGSEGTRDPGAGNARNGEVQIATGITEGEDVVASFYCFNTSGTYSVIEYQVRSSYRTDTDNLLPPIVKEKCSESGSTGTLELYVEDPQGDDLIVRFYTRQGHETEAGPDTRNPVTSETSPTDTVSLNEKLFSFIRYEVDNVAGFTVGGEVGFDTDRLPNISPTLDIGTDGIVSLSWVGDSDTLSVTYEYAISTQETPADFTDVSAPGTTSNTKTGRTGSGPVYEDGSEGTTEATLSQGETMYVKVRGYTHATPSSGDPGEIAQVAKTMPIDTTASSNLVANGDFEAGAAYWGGLMYYGGGPIYTLWTITSTGIEGASLLLLGDPNNTVNVYTSTVLDGGGFFWNETISCAEGDRIDVNADAYVSGSHTLTMYVRWYESDKTFLSQSSILTWTETVATPKSTSIVAPTNAAYAGFRFFIPIDATDAKYAVVDNVVAQFRIAFSDYEVSTLKDVASYSTTTDDVLTWTGSEWDSVAPDTGYDLISKNDFATLPQRSEINFREGSGITITVSDESYGTDVTELTFAGDFSSVDADTVDTYHAAAFLRKVETASLSGDLTITGTTVFSTMPKLQQSSQLNLIKVQPANITASDRDGGLQWESSQAGTGYLFKTGVTQTDGDFYLKRYTSSWLTGLILDRSTGDLTVGGDITTLGANLTFGTSHLIDGDSATYLDIKSSEVMRFVIDSNNNSTTAEFQIWGNSVSGNRLFTVREDGDIFIGASTTTDLKIHEPSAGEWTIEALSTSKLILKANSASKLEIDDGSTNNALVAGFHSSTSAPTTQDYPDGTIWIVYT